MQSGFITQCSFTSEDIVTVFNEDGSSFVGKITGVAGPKGEVVQVYEYLHQGINIMGELWHYDTRSMLHFKKPVMVPSDKVQLMYRSIGRSALWHGLEVRVFDNLKGMKTPAVITDFPSFDERAAKNLPDDAIEVIKKGRKTRLYVPDRWLYSAPDDPTFYLGDRVRMGFDFNGMGEITHFSGSGLAKVISLADPSHWLYHRLGHLRRFVVNDVGALLSNEARLKTPKLEKNQIEKVLL